MSGICTGCGLPDEICVCEDIAREQQEIRITVDSRRYGKLMTIVSGMDENSIDVPGLLSTLKSKCACGGSVHAYSRSLFTRADVDTCVCVCVGGHARENPQPQPQPL